MVGLFLVAAEIGVGLFKTFFQLDEGNTFVQLMCICAALNGRQISGAGEIFSLSVLDHKTWVNVRLGMTALLEMTMDLEMQ